MSFCPHCLLKRRVDISVGPDYIYDQSKTSYCYDGSYHTFENTSISPQLTFTNVNTFLNVVDERYVNLNVIYNNEGIRYCNLSIEIDMHNNFIVNLGKIIDTPSTPRFFIWLQSQCKQCDFRLYSVTCDIEFNTDTKKISPLQLELDTIYIDDLAVDFSYIKNTVNIFSKNETLKIPMWNESFRDSDKLKKRIKTVLTFG